MSSTPILTVKNLSITFQNGPIIQKVLHDVSFEIYPNEVLGIVGESGSGKSITSLAIMGLLSNTSAQITGSITLQGKSIESYTNKQFQNIRGNELSMVFQEPMSALNPSIKCGEQVLEVLLKHRSLSRKQAHIETIALFEKVKLPRAASLFNAYPHQISGGQKQRVMIAMAIACKPKILIADEPTTALDVTVQKEILELLKTLQEETGMSILFISHDLAVVRNFAHRVQVMYKGKIVESATSKHLFEHPKEEYTKALINARPKLNERLKVLPTINDYLNNSSKTQTVSLKERQEHHKKLYQQTPLLEVNNLKKIYWKNEGWFNKKTGLTAVNDVSFKLYPGETLGLVGESGCGKSTIGNAILRLDSIAEGQIKYRGIELTKLKGKILRAMRKEIQLIFQDPFASLNPRLTVGQAIMEPMQVHKLYKNGTQRKAKTIDLLKKVGLEEAHFNRYPHEFSGGQRQRIGIARAIAVKPTLIVCDESVSALDISVQAQVLNLLNELKEDFGFTYIFISHDLAVVKYMADTIVVMNKGIIEEMGEADTIYANPQKKYTQRLINAIPE